MINAMGNFNFIFEKWEVDNNDFPMVDADWVWTRNHVHSHAAVKPKGCI